MQCGGRAENENGNGSLMRILPAALKYGKELASDKPGAVEKIFHLSALTHAHMRSKLGCLIYSKLIANCMHVQGKDKLALVRESLSQCRNYIDSQNAEDIAEEKAVYSRLWNTDAFMNLPEEAIKSSGYVVDTLEAAVWCFLNTDNYKDCVLRAVNLGDDTDTVGAVAGGLAGLYYGLDGIPQEWIAVIPRREWIAGLVEKMAEK